MFTDILKIKPQLDDKDLNTMERKLSGRFAKVAKGFGKSLKNAGLLALGGAILERMLNPLQEVKAAIDRTLNKADSIVTNAKQFNTSNENFLKLQALAEMNGLDPDQLDTLLTKFQGAVAQFRANPQDETVSSIANFAGTKDTAKGFLDFITSLQGVSPDQRNLIQQQIFGEKQVLKMAEFLQANFKESAEVLKRMDFKAMADAAKKLADLEQKNKENLVIRNGNDLIQKAKVIGAGTIANVNRSEVNNLARENGQIGRSAAAFTVEENMQKMQDNLEKLTTQLFTAIPEVFSILEGISKLLSEIIKGWAMLIDLLKKSPLIKGIGSTLKSLNPFSEDE